MKKITAIALLALLQLSQTFAANIETAIVETSYGTIELALDADKAPDSVQNFIRYANSGFYNGTIFHRVIKNFMIQGGGYTEQYQRKSTNPAIKNEASNGLKNNKYTIAMARTNHPHSATSQFFINTGNNDFLNFTRETMNGFGYAVFGEVTKGFDVVDKINETRTGPGGPFPTDAPQQMVVIKSVTIKAKAATPKAEANKTDEGKASKQPAKK